MGKPGKIALVLYFLLAIVSLTAAVSYDQTPAFSREGKNISILKFEVNSTGVNSTLLNISVEYTGSAGSGNLTFVTAYSESENALGVSDLTSRFNITVNEEINGVENITLELGVSSGANANGETVDLNVTGINGVNISLVNEKFSDPAGGTTLDTKAPDLTPMNPSAGQNLSKSVSVGAIWMDKVSGVETHEFLLHYPNGTQAVFQDNNKPVGGSLNDTFDSTRVKDSDYEIHYRVEDSVGHTALIRRPVTIDNTAPIILPVNPGAKAWLKGIMEVNATWEDETTAVKDANYEILSSDGSSVHSGDLNDTFDTTSISGGKYSINFTARDYAGNVGFKKIKVNIDNSKPSLTVYSPKDDSNITYTFWINSSASDPPKKLKSIKKSFWRLRNSSGVQVEQKPIKNDTIVSEDFAGGSYSIVFNVTDKVGHSVEKYLNITIDNEPPHLDLVGPEDTILRSESFGIEALWRDNITGMQYADYEFINSTGKSSSSGSLNETLDASNYPSDNYTIKYLAGDFAANTISKTINFIIDRIKPSVSALVPVKDANISGNATVGAVLTDNLTGLDSSNFTVSNSTYNITGVLNRTVNTRKLSDGEYNISYSFEDGAGNIRSLERTVTVDNTVPKVWNLSLNDTSPSNHSVFRVSGNASDSTTGVKSCNLSASSSRYNLSFELGAGKDYRGFSEKISLKGKEGNFSLAVSCKDFAGNEGLNSSFEYSNGSSGSNLLMDDEAPHLENVYPADAVNSTDPSIELEIRDLSGVEKNSIEFWFNGSQKSQFSLEKFQNEYDEPQYTLTFNSSNLSNRKKYWINVSAKDGPGQISGSERTSASFFVDLNNPEAGKIDLQNYTLTDYVFLNWTNGSDGISGIGGYRVYRNDTLLGNFSKSYYNYTKAPEGYYRYRIEYLDEAGNTNSTFGSTFVDYSAPDLKSREERVEFSEEGGEKTVYINFTVTDESGILNESINFSFLSSYFNISSPRLKVNPTGNLSRRMKGGLKANISEGRDYNLSIEVGDRFRSITYNWTLLTELDTDHGSGGGGSGDSSSDSSVSGGFSGIFNDRSGENKNESNGSISNIKVAIPPEVSWEVNDSTKFIFGVENTLNRSLTLKIRFVSKFRHSVPRNIVLNSGERNVIEGRIISTGKRPPATYPAALILDPVTDGMGKIIRKVDIRLFSGEAGVDRGGYGPSDGYGQGEEGSTGESGLTQENQNEVNSSEKGVIKSASSFVGRIFEGVARLGSNLAKVLSDIKRSIEKGETLRFLVVMAIFLIIMVSITVVVYRSKDEASETGSSTPDKHETRRQRLVRLLQKIYSED
ncbi:MAG: Ig-like domain-containing protein [Candidatus Nanosalina sp.]